MLHNTSFPFTQVHISIFYFFYGVEYLQDCTGEHTCSMTFPVLYVASHNVCYWIHLDLWFVLVRHCWKWFNILYIQWNFIMALNELLLQVLWSSFCCQDDICL